MSELLTLGIQSYLILSGIMFGVFAFGALTGIRLLGHKFTSKQFYATIIIVVWGILNGATVVNGNSVDTAVHIVTAIVVVAIFGINETLMKYIGGYFGIKVHHEDKNEK